MQVASRVAPPVIEEIWIFPPLPDLEESSEFVVFTRREEDGRLRLYTARPRARAADPDAEEVTAHGAVPPDRVPRLLARFQRRVGTEHEPVHVALGGSERRWRALVRLAFPEVAEGDAPVGEAAEPGAGPRSAAGADVDGGGTNP